MFVYLLFNVIQRLNPFEISCIYGSFYGDRVDSEVVGTYSACVTEFGPILYYI